MGPIGLKTQDASGAVFPSGVSKEVFSCLIQLVETGRPFSWTGPVESLLYDNSRRGAFRLPSLPFKTLVIY